VTRTRIKICCIAGEDEARLAVTHGASALGLVSEMPSGPGVIPEPVIAAVADTVPPGVAAFLLTSRRDPEEIAAQARRCRVDTVQLCDRLAPGAHRRLRDLLPGVRTVQVIHVTGEDAIAEASAVAAEAHGILLDSGKPDAARKELGGTGRTHDWEVSARIVAAVPVPVFLAGGLTPENVGEAITRVQPFAVDTCSGVRTGGRLDPEKLARFAAAVHAADRML
jgi:phosphoribosylanthranilate isomerase